MRSDDGGLKEALRAARLAEAAHFDAALDLRDSKSLRLQLLKDDLMPVVRASAEAQALFDLALVPGDPPRLWIDLVTYVVMEPDHRTYRFLQDRQDDRETLFETAERAEMTEAVRRHMAHRLVARERQAAHTPLATGTPVTGYSTAALILAWTSGFAFGALVYSAWRSTWACWGTNRRPAGYKLKQHLISIHSTRLLGQQLANRVSPT